MKAGNSICFFISSLTKAGGTERVCTEIANNLAERGFIVSILTMYSGVPFFNFRTDIQQYAVCSQKKLSKLLAPATVFRVRQKLLHIKPDILINVDSALFIYSRPALAGLKIKNLVWEHFNHNAAKTSFARVVSRMLASKYSDAVITLTQADNIFWTNNKHCKAPIITINNPSPTVKASSDDHLSSKKKIVLSVGRLTEQKGFDRLLQAWQMVQLQNTADWELHIIGSGELQKQLGQQVTSLGLAASVRLIPATPALETHYKEAGIYCLSSRYEGFPMVLLEAQAFGLPIVSFDCETGPAEIVRHNETGLLVKDGDIAAFAQAISSLINDSGRRAIMGANALKHAANYSIDKIINDWQKLVELVN